MALTTPTTTPTTEQPTSPGPVRAGAATPARTGRPVFVDPTGRRRALAGGAVLTTTLTVLAFIVTTVASVAADTGAPARWEPAPAADVVHVGR